MNQQWPYKGLVLAGVAVLGLVTGCGSEGSRSDQQPSGSVLTSTAVQSYSEITEYLGGAGSILAEFDLAFALGDSSVFEYFSSDALIEKELHAEVKSLSTEKVELNIDGRIVFVERSDYEAQMQNEFSRRQVLQEFQKVREQLEAQFGEDIDVQFDVTVDANPVRYGIEFGDYEAVELVVSTEGAIRLAIQGEESELPVHERKTTWWVRELPYIANPVFGEVRIKNQIVERQVLRKWNTIEFNEEPSVALEFQ